MTQIPGFSASTDGALPLYVLDTTTFAAWRDAQDASVAAFLSATGFTAAAGTVALIPGANGLAAAVIGVGDHIELDVAGAQRAGLRGCWINRINATWNHPTLQPDLQFDTLTGLADWLDANATA